MKPATQRGVAAVELALIITPMLIAVLGVVELGRALFQYNTVVKASRDAVRYLAQQDLALGGSAADTMRANATSLVVCGRLACADAPALIAQLSAAKVSVCDYVIPATGNPRRLVLTGQGPVNLVSIVVGADCDGARPAAKLIGFTPLIDYVIPEFNFSPIKVTMASRTF